MTQDEKLSSTSKVALDKSVEALSPEVQTRLRDMRRVALTQQTQQTQAKPLRQQALERFELWSVFSPRVLSAGLAFSLCALLLWPLVNLNTTQDTPTLAASSILDELIVLADFDESELDAIEDIEFAYWLAIELDSVVESEADRANGEGYDERFDGATGKEVGVNAVHNG